MALIDKFEHYYRCEEASGDLVDAIGSLDFTAVNSPLGETGIQGQGRGFFGGDYLHVGDDADLDFSNGSFFFHLWVKQNASPSTAQYVINKSSSGNANTAEFRLTTSVAGQDELDFSVGDGSSNVTVEASKALTSSTWHRVYCGLDANLGQLFLRLDDEAPVTASFSLTRQNLTDDMFIGALRSTNPNFPWVGVMDEIGWGRNALLTPDELSWLYNGRQGRSYSDIQGYAGNYPTKKTTHLHRLLLLG